MLTQNTSILTQNILNISDINENEHIETRIDNLNRHKNIYCKAKKQIEIVTTKNLLFEQYIKQKRLVIEPII